MQAYRHNCSLALIACCVSLLGLTSCDKSSDHATLPKVLFDDPLPQGAIARLGTTRLRCDEPINSIAVDPNAQFIVTASAYGRQPAAIQVWDAKTGKEQSKIQLDDSWVALSPDGATLATTGRYNDLGIRLWNLETKALIREINLGDIKTRTGYTGPSAEGLRNVAFSPDGKLLAVASWVERQQGKPIYSSFTALHLIDLETGKELRHFAFDDDYLSHWPLRFRFAPDGKSIAVIGGKSNKVYVIATESMQVERILGEDVQYATFSTEGRYFAIADHKQTQVFDCWDWKEIQSIPALPYANYSAGVLALSPEGKLIARTGEYSDLLARIWHTKSGRIVREMFNYSPAGAAFLEFTNDGNNLVCGSEKLVRIWDVPEGTEDVLGNTFRGKLHSMAYSPDGKLLALCGEDPGIRVHDATTRKLLFWIGRDEFVRRVAFSPDSQLLASVGHSLRLWKTATGQKIWSRGPEKRIPKDFRESPASVIFLPAGDRIITGSYDGDLRVWDTETGAHLKQHKLGPTGEGQLQVYGLAIIPRSNLLATSGGIVRLLDIEIESVATTFPGKIYNQDAGTPLAVTSDGSTISYEAYLESAEGNDKQGVVLKEVNSADPAQLLLTDNDANYGPEHFSVSFSADGRFLATGSNDRTVRLWNVSSRKEIAILRGHADFVSAVAFSPNGKELASASWDGTVLFWDVSKIDENEMD